MKIPWNLPVTQPVNFTVKFIIWMLLLLLMMMAFPNWRRFLQNSTFPQEKSKKNVAAIQKNLIQVLARRCALLDGLKMRSKRLFPHKINEI